jgi:ankyrin repeat protein
VINWIVFVLCVSCSVAQAKLTPTESRAFTAAIEGNLSALKKLPASFAWNKQDHAGETLLIKAVATGQVEVVQFLLKKKVKLDKRDKAGNTALFYAVANNDVPVAGELILGGSDLTLTYGKKKEHVLFEAARVGAREIGDQILVKNKALLNQLNADDESPLMAAIKGAQTSLAQHWIGQGAQISHKTRNGKTMAQFALDHGVNQKSSLYQALLSQAEAK